MRQGAAGFVICAYPLRNCLRRGSSCTTFAPKQVTRTIASAVKGRISRLGALQGALFSRTSSHGGGLGKRPRTGLSLIPRASASSFTLQ